MLGGAGAAPETGVDDRAALVARAPAVLSDRAEHVAAEAADRLLGTDAQQGRRLGVEVPDAAVAVDAEDPFGDAGEDGLAFGLAAAQLGGELQEAAAHVFHGGGEGAQFDAGAGSRAGRGRREVAAADPCRRGGEGLDGAGQPPADEESREDGEGGHDQGQEEEVADQPRQRSGHRGAGQRGLEQCHHLAGGSLQGPHGDEEVSLLKPVGAGVAGGQNLGPEGHPRIVWILQRALGIEDRHGEAHLPGRAVGERPVEDQGGGGVGAGHLPQGRDRAEQERAVRQPLDGGALDLPPGDGHAAGGEDLAVREDGDAGKAAGGAEPFEEGGQGGGVSGRQQAPDRGPLRQQESGGLDVPRRALHRLLGSGPRELDPRQSLLVREALDQPHGGHRDRDHRQQDEAGVEADQEGAEGGTAHRKSEVSITAPSATRSRS